MQLTGRRVLTGLVLLACGLVLTHGFLLTPFRVPTGSMAPTLIGLHRRCVCPACGMTLFVGADEANGRKAFCGNCGQAPLPLAATPVADGDHLLVNRTAFALRAPRRWEIAVFRWLGSIFIKRLVGLPGEAVALRDGDVVIDGALARKTLAEAKTLRVLVHDAAHVGPAGSPWSCTPGDADDPLVLDGRATPCTRTFVAEALQEATVGDELVYNGGAHAGREAVHDFFLETEVAVQHGHGSLRLHLCDGHDEVEVAFPSDGPLHLRWRAMAHPSECGQAVGPAVTLPPGGTRHLEMAFVDRRLSVAVDGVSLAVIDLPACGPRPGVARPARLQAEGLALRMRSLRLWRDVHYRERGTNAIGGRVVRLGAEQYFVLGDNSPCSDDSRFWPDGGRVDAARLIGPPLWIHLPSRALTLPGGRAWQVPDLLRMRRP